MLPQKVIRNAVQFPTQEEETQQKLLYDRAIAMLQEWGKERELSLHEIKETRTSLSELDIFIPEYYTMLEGRFYVTPKEGE